MPKRGFRITQWNSGKIQKEVEDRAIKAIDKKLSAVVIDAKKNHPGWKNISTVAEGSVKVQRWAKKQGNLIIGTWGSVGSITSWALSCTTARSCGGLRPRSTGTARASSCSRPRRRSA